MRWDRFKGGMTWKDVLLGLAVGVGSLLFALAIAATASILLDLVDGQEAHAEPAPPVPEAAPVTPVHSPSMDRESRRIDRRDGQSSQSPGPGPSSSSSPSPSSDIAMTDDEPSVAPETTDQESPLAVIDPAVSAVVELIPETEVTEELTDLVGDLPELP